MAIDDSERNDFVAVLNDRGLAANDFELSVMEHPLPAGGIAPVRGEVTVRNHRTGVTRRYACGHGTAWVVEFQRDVDAGIYR